MVEDCICCDWTIEEGSTEQTIYTTNGLCAVLSGKVKYCTASSSSSTDEAPRFITVEFLRGSKVIDSKKVLFGSCLAFTVAKIDHIKIKSNNSKFTVSGDFCINTNYAIH